MKIFILHVQFHPNGNVDYSSTLSRTCAREGSFESTEAAQRAADAKEGTTAWRVVKTVKKYYEEWCPWSKTWAPL